MAERKYREAAKPLEAVKVPLFSAARERVGEIEVAGAVFGRDRRQIASARSGADAAGQSALGHRVDQDRGFISGGGNKPWRQKGTGRARAGSTRSPIWRHGGTIFGPQPRDYSYKMPKKAWRRALCLALSDRAAQRQAGDRRSRWSCPSPRPRRPRRCSSALGLKHALIVLGEGDETFFAPRATWPRTRCCALAGLNVYDLLNYDEVLMTEPRLARAIEARLEGEAQ